PYGQAPRVPGSAQTRVSGFEEGGSYVAMRGLNLEQMYRKGQSPAIASWTRDVVYVRPKIFVVYDRTTIANGSLDQWQAFHLAANPNEVAAQDGHRFDVGQGSGFAGAVTTLLPSGHTTATVDLFGGGK